MHHWTSPTQKSQDKVKTELRCTAWWFWMETDGLSPSNHRAVSLGVVLQPCSPGLAAGAPRGNWSVSTGRCPCRLDPHGLCGCQSLSPSTTFGDSFNTRSAPLTTALPFRPRASPWASPAPGGEEGTSSESGPRSSCCFTLAPKGLESWPALSTGNCPAQARAWSSLMWIRRGKKYLHFFILQIGFNWKQPLLSGRTMV